MGVRAAIRGGPVVAEGLPREGRLRQRGVKVGRVRGAVGCGGVRGGHIARAALRHRRRGRRGRRDGRLSWGISISRRQCCVKSFVAQCCAEGRDARLLDDEAVGPVQHVQILEHLTHRPRCRRRQMEQPPRPARRRRCSPWRASHRPRRWVRCGWWPTK